MRWKKEVVVVAVTLLALSATAAAQEAGKSQARAAGRVATGTVTAVTPDSRTVVVESRLKGQPWILGVKVPKGAAIAADGKTKKLEDLKVGDRVRLRWIREENRLVAESIAIVGVWKP